MSSILTRLRLRSFLCAGVLLLGSAVPPRIGAAAADDTEDPRPLRLSFIESTVSFWRTGADTWASARRNTPLAPGDHLYASQDGRLEIQIDDQAFARAEHETELVVERSDPALVQLQVSQGTLSLDVDELDPALTIEINAPGVAVRIFQAGYYRIEARDNASTYVISRRGEAEIILGSGERWRVRAEELAVVDPDLESSVRFATAPAIDEWDRWNQERTAASRRSSARSLPAGMFGEEDLDRHGTWAEEPQYGRVWFPYSVAAGWAPYSVGNWIWDPWFGWTWIDDSPWGWAPFHYGRWVRVGPRWGWTPGPPHIRTYYAPAVVGFVSGSWTRVSVSVGPVAWVALGWGEPILPWWGSPRFVGRPCWRGWGGPRIVNNVVIHDTRIVHVDKIRYTHIREHGALVRVPRNRFRNGRIDPGARLEGSLRNPRPLRGFKPPRPTARALAPVSAPEDVRVPMPARPARPRPSVATRQPPDPSQRLRAAGLQTQRTGVERAPVRIPSRIEPQPRPRQDMELAPSTGLERAPAARQRLPRAYRDKEPTGSRAPGERGTRAPAPSNPNQVDRESANPPPPSRLEEPDPRQDRDWRDSYETRERYFRRPPRPARQEPPEPPREHDGTIESRREHSRQRLREVPRPQQVPDPDSADEGTGSYGSAPKRPQAPPRVPGVDRQEPSLQPASRWRSRSMAPMPDEPRIAPPPESLRESPHPSRSGWSGASHGGEERPPRVVPEAAPAPQTSFGSDGDGGRRGTRSRPPREHHGPPRGARPEQPDAPPNGGGH